MSGLIPANLDLPTPDVNNQTDVFALDLESNETWYLSVNEFGEQGNGPSTHPVIRVMVVVAINLLLQFCKG